MLSNSSPFSPRSLTKSELDNNDIYLTTRPGRRTPVELVGPLRLAQWLLLIFDSQCRDCVERPRQLTLHPDITVEIDFWTQNCDGSEMFWHVVSDKSCESGPSGRIFRDTTLWAEAARKTGIPLTFVQERHILQRGQRVANYFRMLPHAQAAYHLPDGPCLRDRVAECFAHCPLPMTFEQIEGSLLGLDKASVRSTLCGLIYEGAITMDADLPLSERTVLHWSTKA